MRSFISACLLAAIAPLATADYSLPPQHTAEYTLEKGPLTVARATTKFYPAGDTAYLYRLHLRTTGLASVFSDNRLRERSRGRITETGYRPTEYYYRRSGGDEPESARVHFDWQQGRVNSQGSDEWDLAIPDGTLDRVVSPLQLMRDLSVNGEAAREMTYRIADDGELKSYDVRIGERETVSVDAGKFEAVRVVRQSEDGDKETRLWCAPALDYLPVKMTRIEDDEDEFTLELESVEGIEPEA